MGHASLPVPSVANVRKPYSYDIHLLPQPNPLPENVKFLSISSGTSQEQIGIHLRHVHPSKS